MMNFKTICIFISIIGILVLLTFVGGITFSVLFSSKKTVVEPQKQVQTTISIEESTEYIDILTTTVIFSTSKTTTAATTTTTTTTTITTTTIRTESRTLKTTKTTTKTIELKKDSNCHVIGKKQYCAYNDLVTYNEAKRFCRKQCMRLPVLETQKEFQELEEAHLKKIGNFTGWIGLLLEPSFYDISCDGIKTPVYGKLEWDEGKGEKPKNSMLHVQNAFINEFYKYGVIIPCAHEARIPFFKGCPPNQGISISLEFGGNKNTFLCEYPLDEQLDCGKVVIEKSSEKCNGCHLIGKKCYCTYSLEMSYRNAFHYCLDRDMRLPVFESYEEFTNLEEAQLQKIGNFTGWIQLNLAPCKGKVEWDNDEKGVEPKGIWFHRKKPWVPALLSGNTVACSSYNLECNDNDGYSIQFDDRVNDKIKVWCEFLPNKTKNQI